MEPAARGCRVGVLVGGDTGEFFLATAGVFLVQLPCGVVGTGFRCGWGRRRAPCWVLKEQPVVVVFQSRGMSGSLSRRQAWPGLAYRMLPPFFVGGVAGVGLVGCGLVVC